MANISVSNLKKALSVAKENMETECIRYDWSCTMTGREFKKWFTDRLNKKINRNERQRGRKEDSQWQTEIMRASHKINTPRLIIDWLPQDLKYRFSHRLRENIII